MTGGPSRHDRIVVAGGSLAGIHAARELRRRGHAGRLTVVEPELGEPYERYPLSKDFLDPGTSATGLPLRTAGLDVEWLRGCRVVGLDLAQRHVATDDGRELRYDGLVIATGARARTPFDRAALSLRTLADAAKLRTALDRRPKAVVVLGGGLIGSEVASAVADHGLPVTLVSGRRTPLRSAVGEIVARQLLDRRRRHGVRVVPRRARSVRGDPHGDREVRLDDGTTVRADLVVAAMGTMPNADWLSGSGLDVRDGLRCTPTLFAAGRPDVVAAGDVVRMSYPVAGGLVARVEHWRHSMEQARLAAANLLAGPERARTYAVDPGFSTRLHGHDVLVSGFPHIADDSRTVWGSLADGPCVVVLGRGGWYVGAVSVDATARLLDLLRRLPAVCARPCRLDAVVARVRQQLE